MCQLITFYKRISQEVNKTEYVREANLKKNIVRIFLQSLEMNRLYKIVNLSKFWFHWHFKLWFLKQRVYPTKHNNWDTNCSCSFKKKLQIPRSFRKCGLLSFQLKNRRRYWILKHIQNISSRNISQRNISKQNLLNQYISKQTISNYQTYQTIHKSFFETNSSYTMREKQNPGNFNIKYHTLAPPRL